MNHQDQPTNENHLIGNILAENSDSDQEDIKPNNTGISGGPTNSSGANGGASTGYGAPPKIPFGATGFPNLYGGAFNNSGTPDRVGSAPPTDLSVKFFSNESPQSKKIGNPFSTMAGATGQPTLQSFQNIFPPPSDPFSNQNAGQQVDNLNRRPSDNYQQTSSSDALKQQQQQIQFLTQQQTSSNQDPAKSNEATYEPDLYNSKVYFEYYQDVKIEDRDKMPLPGYRPTQAELQQMAEKKINSDQQKEFEKKMANMSLGGDQSTPQNSTANNQALRGPAPVNPGQPGFMGLDPSQMMQMPSYVSQYQQQIQQQQQQQAMLYAAGLQQQQNNQLQQLANKQQQQQQQLINNSIFNTPQSQQLQQQQTNFQSNGAVTQNSVGGGVGQFGTIQGFHGKGKKGRGRGGAHYQEQTPPPMPKPLGKSPIGANTTPQNMSQAALQRFQPYPNQATTQQVNSQAALGFPQQQQQQYQQLVQGANYYQGAQMPGQNIQNQLYGQIDPKLAQPQQNMLGFPQQWPSLQQISQGQQTIAGIQNAINQQAQQQQPGLSQLGMIGQPGAYQFGQQNFGQMASAAGGQLFNQAGFTGGALPGQPGLYQQPGTVDSQTALMMQNYAAMGIGMGNPYASAQQFAVNRMMLGNPNGQVVGIGGSTGIIPYGGSQPVGQQLAQSQSAQPTLQTSDSFGKKNSGGSHSQSNQQNNVSMRGGHQGRGGGGNGRGGHSDGYGGSHHNPRHQGQRRDDHNQSYFGQGSSSQNEGGSSHGGGHGRGMMGRDHHGQHQNQQHMGGDQYSNQQQMQQQPQPPKSEFLEDLRAKIQTGKKIEIREIKDHVVECSMDQYGSRFIQQKYDVTTHEEKDLIFSEILPEANNLMNDVFGNYVVQKLFEYGTDVQRATLAEQLLGNVLKLTKSMYGCRVVQKALEVISLDQQKLLVQELKDSVLDCIYDQNGNHVIQKCIEKMPNEAVDFIISAFSETPGAVSSLCVHTYGCRVIQRVLENCLDRQTKPILDQIIDDIQMLTKDQFGNYVIQHILEQGRGPEDKNKIVKSIKGQVIELSNHKFASNVVEKCLEFGSEKERKEIIDEILESNGFDLSEEVNSLGGGQQLNGALYTMMKDRYGNYVIQKCIEVGKGKQREVLIKKITACANVLRKQANYSRHVYNFIEKMSSDGAGAGAPMNNGEGGRGNYVQRGDNQPQQYDGGYQPQNHGGYAGGTQPQYVQKKSQGKNNESGGAQGKRRT